MMKLPIPMRRTLALVATGLIASSLYAQAAAAAPSSACAPCPEMATIPAGSFKMGDVNGVGEYDEVPVRTVTFARPFEMARREVTVREFRAFVEATGYDSGSSCWTHERQRTTERRGRTWRNPGFRQGDDHPVTCLNWDDAQAYIAWLNAETGRTFRLPTEAEWEYAARAGTKTEYFWGDDIADGCGSANVADQSVRGVIVNVPLAPCSDGFAYTSPVASFAPNAFGLYDMLGNVFEWVEDCYQPRYDRAPSDGSAIGAWACDDPRLKGRRATRGGSWYSRPIYVRSADRNLDDHPRQIGWRKNVSNRAANVGFRLARDVSVSPSAAKFNE